MTLGDVGLKVSSTAEKNKKNKSASGSYKIFFPAIVATSIALSTKNVL